MLTLLCTSIPVAFRFSLPRIVRMIINCVKFTFPFKFNLNCIGFFNLTNYFSIQLLSSEILLIHSVSVIQSLHKGATTNVSTAMDGLMTPTHIPGSLLMQLIR